MSVSAKPNQFANVVTAPKPLPKGQFAQLEIDYPDDPGFLSKEELAMITPWSIASEL
jgi:hypothetical protein